MKKLLLIFLVTIIYGKTLFAQNTAVLKHAVYDKVSGQIVKVFEQTGKPEIIKSGNYKDFPTVDISSILIFPKGEKSTLPQNEIVLAIENGYLFSQKFDIVKNTTTVKSYKLLSASIEAVGTLSFVGQQRVTVLGNKRVIITDEWELYGTTINFYNYQLKPINSFKPTNGFENAVFVTPSLGDRIVAVVHTATPDPVTEYLEFEASTCKLLRESNLERGYLNPIRLLSIGNSILVIEKAHIFSVAEGKITWEKSVILPEYDLIADESQNSIFYFLSDKIIKLSANNGQEDWSVNFSAFNLSGKDSDGYVFRPLAINTKRENIFFVIGKSNRGVLSAIDFKQNLKLLSLDNSGRISNEKSLDLPSAKFVALLKGANDKILLILDEQEINLNE